MRVFNHYVHPPVLLLCAVEFCICIGALYVAVTGLAGLYASEWVVADPGTMLRAGVFAALVVFCMAAMGLYRMPLVRGVGGLFARVAAAFAVAALGLGLLFVVFPDLRLGTELMTLAGAVALGGTVAGRIAYVNLAKEPMFKQRVLVYGAGRRAKALADVDDAERRGFAILGYIPAEGDHPDQVAAERVLDRNERSLEQWIRTCAVDQVVVAMDDRRRGFPLEQLLRCRMRGTRIVDLATFLELQTGRVDLRVMDPSWLIFADGFRRSLGGAFFKRVLDVIGSLLLLVVSMPLMVLTALLILLEDGRPVLYRQVRVGMNGRPFTILKFRSMCREAEDAGRPVWATENDARITRVGRVIRKLRIDELPQLLNVLVGHMSLVGPRPERPEFVRDLARRIPFYMERHLVRPGITGWAQLSFRYGASEEDALVKLQYDLFYIKNRSMLFDVMMLLQTVEVVLWQKGSR